MSTVREKIINALTLFYAKIKTVFVQTNNVVNNCASTSTTYPLSAAQGTSLQTQIDELNSNLISMQDGSILLDWSNNEWKTETITFTAPFSKAPLVNFFAITSNITYYDTWKFYVVDVSAEKVTFAYKSNNFNGSYVAHWRAIGVYV